MNCTFHVDNKVQLICLAPHKCQCQRKLCIECLYEHGVDLKQHIVLTNVFQKMITNKFKESEPQLTLELAQHRIQFKQMLSSTQNILKQIWDELMESIQQIYDLLEMEDKFMLKINMNPTELSNTDLEKFVQFVLGKPLEELNIQKMLMRLEMAKNYWEIETKVFCEKLQKEMKEILQLKNQADNSYDKFQSINGVAQFYNRNEDLYQVLTQTKNIDGSFLNELITKLRKEQISNCLEYFSKQNKDQAFMKQFINIIYNIIEMNFNKKNYSSENYEQIKKDLIQNIQYDQHIIEFLKFLVRLTSIDERFIQCGSNSLNLLVKMKVDMREENFENIRIRDTTLVGGNFVRCNFNGSEFNNVDISGMNLNQAQLVNCKWKNIKIHELNKLDGHSKTVCSVAFSPDGTTLASASQDYSIRLWDVKTGELQAKLDGHLDGVLTVNFSPDGTSLASGSADKSNRLWDVKTGELQAKLDGHSSTVYSVNFSPDGTTLSSGSADNSIRLWDVKTGQQKAQLDGHSDGILTVNFSPDGTTLASGGVDNSIRLWDVKTGQQILPSDNRYQNILTQFSPQILNNNLLQESGVYFLHNLVNSPVNYLIISQQLLFQSQGALILKGEFINQSGIDLRALFQQRGSCVLENQIGQQKQQN